MEITKRCTGCMACYSSCPINAIQIIQNQEGFYVPKIDTNKCINCGRCNLVCPQNQNKELKNNASDYCIAAQATENECLQSSSGGVFPLLSNYILEKGGYVCGATFDDDFKKVKHIIVNNKSNLYKLKSSKYVQSYIGDVLKEIKVLLEEGKLVLFSGTPCQVSGLKMYLSKDYENLFTVDLLCHGAPSPLVWEKYLTEIANRREIKSVNFRDKKYGWKPSLCVNFKNGDTFVENNYENLYFLGFLQNLAINNACYHCKYTDVSRTADITLGDFWGIDKLNNNIRDIQKGVSLVLLNTPKGKEIFNHINLTISELHLVKNAVLANPVLESPVIKHYNRKTFFENLYKKAVIENLKESLNTKYDGIIANFWWTNNNYGAVLSAYAIQKFLSLEGYDFKLLNFLPDNKIYKFAFDFIQEHLEVTHRIYNIKQLHELNKCTDNFVVGTDQVFRYKYIGKSLFPIYTLAFTDFNKKRIAFSASFGTEKFNEANIIEKYIFKKCLQRFDSISVRENSGIKLCKKEFGLKVDDILDPVLLLDKSFWDNLADTKDVKTRDKLVSYVLDENEDTLKIYDFLENKYGVKTFKLANSEQSPEEFLSAIKQAKFVITDSFHGMCFALIFNKKVICLKNEKRGNSRFNNLNLKFNIDSLFYNGLQDIKNTQEPFKSFDYSDFINKIESERHKAKKWLKRAFSMDNNKSNCNYINEKYVQILLSLKEINLINDLKEKVAYRSSLKQFNKAIRANRNKKIVFWGASLFLQDFLKKYKPRNKNVIGIVDKNCESWDKKLYNYIIYPPEKLVELKPDIVICTIKNNHGQVYKIIKEYVNKNCPTATILPDIFE